MHDLDSLLGRLHPEAAPARPVRTGILAALRRCEPALVALIALAQLLVITLALAWATHHPAPGTDVPSPRPQPAPTSPQENR